MSPRKEIAVVPQLLEKILELAGTDMILIGGQALAFWSAYYQAPVPAMAITRDIDFIGTRTDVERLARGLDGKAAFPHKRALTLLVGQITKDLPEGEYINIDVMFRVYSDIDIKVLRSRSVLAENAAGPFRVMHPVDVLQDRLESVYGLTEKQDEHGLEQLRLAIETTRRFLGDIAARETSDAGKPARSATLRHIARIETMALSDAGRKVAKRFGVHVADAIEPAPLKHIKEFMNKKLPQVLKLMSADRRNALRPR